MAAAEAPAAGAAAPAAGAAAEEAAAVGFVPTLGESARGAARNPIRSIVLKQQATPGCLMLAGGKPVAAAFPRVCDVASQDAMNYGPHLAVGLPELRAWAREFVQRHHAPPAGWERMDVVMTPGSTNSIAMMLLLCTDPREPVLCEEFTYTGLTAACAPLGRRAVGVRMDAEGMLPCELRRAAARLAEGGSAARLVYIVPNGHNPTTITMPTARRRELYSVARECGLLIVEDDSYFWLGLGEAGASSEAEMPGLGGVPASFLSMDVDGRVCRLDSCSKVLAPGFRMGWMTAPRVLTEKMGVLAEVLTWSLSAFAQQALLRCVRELGHSGLHEHAQRVQWAYRQRRDWCVAALERHVAGLAEWTVPRFGMFLWVRVPGVHDTRAFAEALVERGVAVVPGGAFLAEPYAAPCGHFRASFTQLMQDTADEAARRLGEALRDERWLAAAAARPPAEAAPGGPPAAKARRLA